MLHREATGSFVSERYLLPAGLACDVTVFILVLGGVRVGCATGLHVVCWRGGRGGVVCCGYLALLRDAKKRIRLNMRIRPALELGGGDIHRLGFHVAKILFV